MQLGKLLTNLLARRGNLARIFGGSVINQGLLSATNLVAGLILVRRASPAEYGYYVLINSAVPLLSQLQVAFINPIMPSRVTVAAQEDRRNFIGSLIREQRGFLRVVPVLGVLIAFLAWAAGFIGTQAAVIWGLGAVASTAWLYREFFRMVLISYRRPFEILRADVVFAIILTTGIWLSTLTSKAATISSVALIVAAVAGGWLMSHAVWRHEAWNTNGPPGALAQTIRLGAWAAAGTVIHWLFSQGYTFIVAGGLSVTAVASIAATRLLLSPLGVFSMGIVTMMYSTSTLWLKHHGMRGLLRRVVLFALMMVCIAVTYIAIVWYLRDWIFANVIKKDFPQRDLLLTIWSMIFVATVIRDQVIFLPIALGRFKLLAVLTLVCAVLGLSTSFVAIQLYGVAGGLLGLLVGEIAHVVGVALLTAREMRMHTAAQPAG